MKSISKWLMIPPAAALLLVLGTLSMRGPSPNAPPAETLTASVAQPATAPVSGTESKAPALPRTPGFWKVGSALIGVLVLGGLGLYGLRRLRGGAVPTRDGTFLTLRQTMRLSARQALHAVEFDDRVLIVGESERGLSLLESAKAPSAHHDEVEAANRAAEMLSADLLDGGAVPKDLVIPRPANGPVASRPRQPAMPREEAQAENLRDFRSLLKKAGLS